MNPIGLEFPPKLITVKQSVYGVKINNKTKINKIIFLQMYKYTKWKPMVVHMIKCNIKYAIQLYSLLIAI